MFNPKSFFKIRDYFMTYREEEERAEVFRCVKKQPTYVIKQVKSWLAVFAHFLEV